VEQCLAVRLDVFDQLKPWARYEMAVQRLAALEQRPSPKVLAVHFQQVEDYEHCRRRRGRPPGHPRSLDQIAAPDLLEVERRSAPGTASSPSNTSPMSRLNNDLSIHLPDVRRLLLQSLDRAAVQLRRKQRVILRPGSCLPRVRVRRALRASTAIIYDETYTYSWHNIPVGTILPAGAALTLLLRSTPRRCFGELLFCSVP